MPRGVTPRKHECTSLRPVGKETCSSPTSETPMVARKGILSGTGSRSAENLRSAHCTSLVGGAEMLVPAWKQVPRGAPARHNDSERSHAGAIASVMGSTLSSRLPGGRRLGTCSLPRAISTRRSEDRRVVFRAPTVVAGARTLFVRRRGVARAPLLRRTRPRSRGRARRVRSRARAHRRCAWR